MAYSIGGKTYVLHEGDSLFFDGRQDHIALDLKRSFGWYDFMVKVSGSDHFEKRYAGRVGTGKSGYSNPLMGKVEI